VNGSAVRRTSALGGLLLFSVVLAGCGEAEALPDNLCTLVGDSLVTEIVPGAVVEPPYRAKKYGLNTITCDAASPDDAARKGTLHVVLERHGPCTSIRRGETVCNPRETNAETSYESQCESLLINPERYGREVKVDGIGQQACATAAETEGKATVHLLAQHEGDVVVISYTTQPSPGRDQAVDAARKVAGHVLDGLGTAG